MQPDISTLLSTTLCPAHGTGLPAAAALSRQVMASSTLRPATKPISQGSASPRLQAGLFSHSCPLTFLSAQEAEGGDLGERAAP